ncbi:AAA family ATPase [archaeon]|nr:AAA family ATPase [archaeon]MBT7128603.1 AAA family ATPase [archaeon]
MDITNYMKAGYPAIYINTTETDRAIESIHADGYESFAWDCLRGIISPETNRTVEDVIDPLGALQWLSDRQESILIVQNFHHFLGSVEILQAIANNIHIYKGQGSCLIMAGPHLTLPQEIEKYFTVLDFALPSTQDLTGIMQELGEAVGVDINPTAVEAAKGLTEFEAETAFALSLVETKSFDPEIITKQKRMMIRRTGLMEFFPPVPMDQVGGLEPFKQYLGNRIKAFELGNEYLPKPKALLLVGIPGTGKSLSCKAAASILNWPLIRLDISALKGSLVGESEKKMRQATATIDAFGKAVVWLDEIEKSFSGIKSSGQSDGGTTAGMFGHFLTWIQETSSPILVMATANDISSLPPEFMRAGRFDAMFFVDIPTTKERLEIIRIMNERYNSLIPEDQVQALQGWTGAEIEQLAKDSLFDGLDTAIANIVPLSKTMKEDIGSLRDWAKSRARRANDYTENEVQLKVRRIS